MLVMYKTSSFPIVSIRIVKPQNLTIGSLYSTHIRSSAETNASKNQLKTCLYDLDASLISLN